MKTFVKSIKQQRMVVVPHRPWLPLLLAIAVLFTLLFAVLASYKVGLLNGAAELKFITEERNQLLIEVAGLSGDITGLRQKLANVELGAELDRKASEDVRMQVLTLKSEIATLEEDVKFYRNLMSPEDDKKGLTIGALHIAATRTPHQYDYKLVIQQLATRHSLLNGRLTFNIVGRQGGQPYSLSLNELDESVIDEKIKLRFKYFQALEGRLSLPKGFEPEVVELVASSSGKNAVRVEKKFAWLVQER